MARWHPRATPFLASHYAQNVQTSSFEQGRDKRELNNEQLVRIEKNRAVASAKRAAKQHALREVVDGVRKLNGPAPDASEYPHDDPKGKSADVVCDPQGTPAQGRALSSAEMRMAKLAERIRAKELRGDCG